MPPSGNSVVVTRPLFQEEVGGSIPTSPHKYFFSKIPTDTARDYISQRHYSKTFPRAARVCFGIYQNQKIVGACSFGQLPERYLRRWTGNLTVRELVELTRLYLEDDLPKNSESQFIGWCLREIKKLGIKAVVSFSDPSVGHSGIIYKATGFTNSGMSAGGRGIKLNGKWLHPLRARKIYGTSNPKMIPNSEVFNISKKIRFTKGLILGIKYLV